jgi:hypothetical protein
MYVISAQEANAFYYDLNQICKVNFTVQRIHFITISAWKVENESEVRRKKWENRENRKQENHKQNFWFSDFPFSKQWYRQTVSVLSYEVSTVTEQIFKIQTFYLHPSDTKNLKSHCQMNPLLKLPQHLFFNALKTATNRWTKAQRIHKHSKELFHDR